MEVIIDNPRDDVGCDWSRQFVKASPQTRQRIEMPARPTADQIVQTIEKAVKQAAGGGTVIFSVGHAAAADGDRKAGMVELAPNGAFRVDQELVFYDHDPDGKAKLYSSNKAYDDGKEAELKQKLSKEAADEAKKAGTEAQRKHEIAELQKLLPGIQARRKRWDLYTRICTVFKSIGLHEVVLLSCKVGDAQEFVDKIAGDWGVTVVAYKRRVVFHPEGGTTPVRVYLEGDPPGLGTNTARGRTELPKAGRYVTAVRRQ